MLEIVMLLAGGAGIVAGHVRTRRYVRSRLRFVDAPHSPAAPLVAGAAATLVAAPVVWLLPVLGTGTAVLFGAGVGWGVHRGADDVRALSR